MRVICSECGAEVRSCEVSHSVSLFYDREGEMDVEIYTASPIYTCAKCGNKVAVLNVAARLTALDSIKNMDGE